MTARQSVFLVVPAALALGWAGTVAATDVDQKFPATGQTTCWDSSGNPIACAGTGQDGAIQAGATLSYNNGNGTITDRNTRLVWEKKDDNNVGGIHDKDNFYTWDQAFQYVATLNTICAKDEMVTCLVNADCEAAGVGGKCGFAGKRDWRVPNYKELTSILNLENPAAVSAAFNTNCVAFVSVTGGSCTAKSFYWSSTTDAIGPSGAWFVNFDGGGVSVFDKGDAPGRCVAARRSRLLDHLKGGLGGFAPQPFADYGSVRTPADLQAQLRSVPLPRAGGAGFLPFPQVLGRGGAARVGAAGVDSFPPCGGRWG